MTHAALHLSHFLPYRLSYTSNLVSETVAARYRDLFGLAVAEWRVMAVVAEQGRATQQDVCRFTRMDKVTISRAAAALVERHLIARGENPADKRSRLLSLTAEGQKLYDMIAGLALEAEAQAFACLSEQERAHLGDLLSRINAHILTTDLPATV